MKLLEFIKKLFYRRQKPKFVPDITYLEDVLTNLASRDVEGLKAGPALQQAFWEFNWYRSSKYCFHPKDSQILDIAFSRSSSPASFLHNFKQAATLELTRLRKARDAKLCK